MSSAGGKIASIGTSALVALALFAGPLLVTPAVIHGANPLEFEVSLGQVLTWPALATLVLAALLCAGLALAGRLYSRFAAVALAAAWLFWLQGHVMVWDYGVLDGRALDWRGEGPRGLVDGLAWLAGLGLAFHFAGRLRPHLATLAVALLAVQAATVTAVLLTRDTPPAFHHYRLEESRKFDFSRDRNVILLVLDAFQADVMQELLDGRPELADDLDGFTWYRNAASAFAKTYPSIPLMFTGRWYDNSVPIEAFVEEAFEADGFTVPMIENGWRVDLFPAIPRVVHHSRRVTSNLASGGATGLAAAEAARLLDLSMFRVSPQVLKRFWLNDHRWRLGPAAEPLARMDESRQEALHRNAAARFALGVERHGRAVLDAPAFRFYHLMVPHEPFLLHEDFSEDRMPPGREGFVRQSATALKIVDILVERLKAEGVYDDSTLLVVSDHGGGDYDAGVRLDGLPSGAIGPSRPGHGIPAQHHASALPLVLVKYAGERGPLRISDTPASIADVANSIRWAAGLDDGPGARRLGGTPEAREAPRRYYFYRHQGWHEGFLPPLTEYRLDGHSWDSGAWFATGRVISPGGDETAAARYRWGEAVGFSRDASASTWLFDGWSGSNDEGTWSNAASAGLHVPLAQPPGRIQAQNAEVRFRLVPFLARGRIDAQPLDLAVNGRPVAHWRVDVGGCYAARLPAPVVLDQSELRFRFDLPGAASPGQFGISEDYRTLGVRLERMTIGAATGFPLGVDVDLPTRELECALRTPGWSRGPDAPWSTGPRAAIVLRLPPGMVVDPTPLALDLDLEPYLGDGRRTFQTVRVASGEVELSWSVDGPGRFTVPLGAPETSDDELTVQFSFPDAVSPASLGLSDDRRPLAVRLTRLRLRRAGE